MDSKLVRFLLVMTLADAAVVMLVVLLSTVWRFISLYPSGVAIILGMMALNVLGIVMMRPWYSPTALSDKAEAFAQRRVARYVWILVIGSFISAGLVIRERSGLYLLQVGIGLVLISYVYYLKH